MDGPLFPLKHEKKTIMETKTRPLDNVLRPLCHSGLRWRLDILNSHLVYEYFSSFADSEGEDDHEDWAARENLWRCCHKEVDSEDLSGYFGQLGCLKFTVF